MFITNKYFRNSNGEVKLTYWDNGTIVGQFKQNKVEQSMKWIGNSIAKSYNENKALAIAARKLKVKVAKLPSIETDIKSIKYFGEYK